MINQKQSTARAIVCCATLVAAFAVAPASAGWEWYESNEYQKGLAAMSEGEKKRRMRLVASELTLDEQEYLMILESDRGKPYTGTEIEVLFKK